MKEPSEVTLARIDENVIHLTQVVGKINDKTDVLWDERCKCLGKKEASGIAGLVTGWMVNAIIAATTAWAIIKGGR